MGDELLKHRLKREMRASGVGINRLLIDVSDDRIVMSGEVATYYEIQLIESCAASLSEGRQVHNNLSVVPSVLDMVSLNASSEGDGERHRLRNRLNEIGLATHLLAKVLEQGDVQHAKTLVANMLESLGSVESDLSKTEKKMPRLCVLVVEDDSQQSLLLTGLLRHLGSEVARAENADSAYRVLNEGFMPDIVLLDMHFPDEDGANIARAIRKRPHCDEVQIIIVSGTHPSEMGLSLDDGDVDAWIPKPINVDRLLQTIQELARSKKSPSNDGSSHQGSSHQ